MKDRFLIDETISNLASTVKKLPELDRKARTEQSGAFYAIGYLEGTVQAALARLESFAAANPE